MGGALLRSGLALSLVGASLGQTTPKALTFNGTPLRGLLPAGAWADYFVVANDEDSNIVFKVNATSEYANALGIYVSEDLPSTERTREANGVWSVGQFLDFDTTSMIVVDGIRHYSVVIGQCYVRAGQTYYLSVFGKNVAGGPKPSVPYNVAVEKVPALIPMNGTVSGNVCDNRYMHYYWELDSSFTSGGVRTTVSKQEGELDSAFMRYEKCAGLAGANLASVELSGHGQPSGSVTLPQGPTPLEAGRYYVSIKGQQELCGQYQISATQINQQALLSSPAPTLRSGGPLALLASLVPTWLLSRASR